MPLRFLGTAYKEEEGRALREGPRQFDHPELYSGTNGFNRARNLIGEGGFGPVFRGRLRNGQVVAIKRLNPNGIQGIQEFRTEIMMLSHLDHPNVIKLIGYCANEVHRIVVYEYMPMGSLDKHLFDRRANQPPLDWNTRMKIATGAARGLEYLHNRRRPQIIYRDVKSSNILLDKGFEPKLSDFGLARLGPVGDATHVTTRVMGTYGYCAPEYAMTGHLTTRTDVYSFGVVLLEILTGRRAIDNTRRDRNEENLVLWARPLIRKAENFPAMVDPLLQGRFPLRCFLQAMAVAAMCIHEIASARPEMNGVVQALELLVHPEDGPRNTAPEIRLAPPPPQEGGGASPVRRSSRSAPLLQGTGIDPPVRRASHEGGRSSSSAAPRQQGTRIGPPVRRASHDAGPSSSAAPQQQFIRINMPVQRASYDGGSSSSAPRRQGITIDSLVRRRRRSHDGGSSRSAPRPPRPPGGIRIGSPIRRGGDRSPSTHRDPPEIVEEGVGIIIAEAVGTPSVGSSSQLDEPGRLESQPARSSSLPGGSESRPAGSRSPPDEVGGSVSRRPGKEPVTETETDRERAVAEAMEWAEHLREERAAGKEIVDDTSDDTSD